MYVDEAIVNVLVFEGQFFVNLDGSLAVVVGFFNEKEEPGFLRIRD